MGFGNMGAGFGCSQFTPNQGEEMPTMLHMGYDGEGFGDDPSGEGILSVLHIIIFLQLKLRLKWARRAKNPHQSWEKWAKSAT